MNTQSPYRKTIAFVGITAAIACAVIMQAGDVHADHRRSDDNHGGSYNAHLFLKTFDRNGDRQLTQEAINLGQAEWLANFDRNSDRRIDLNEYSSPWLQAVRNRMVDQFQALDDKGDGKIPADEFTAPTNTLVRRKDRNGDGSLTVRELRLDDDDWFWRAGPSVT